MDTNTIDDGLRSFFLEEEDRVNNTASSSFCFRPNHYKNAGTEQDCIAYCLNNGIGFLEGNVIKYVTRWREKNGLEDLKKAQEYLRRLIANEEGHEES